VAQVYDAGPSFFELIAMSRRHAWELRELELGACTAGYANPGAPVEEASPSVHFLSFRDEQMVPVF
jgi:hypothetical protein